MPKHFAVGINIQTGEALFVSAKTYNVTFPKAFTITPSVDVILSATHASPPFRTNSTATGFTINTQTNFTGTAYWKATQR